MNIKITISKTDFNRILVKYLLNKYFSGYRLLTISIVLLFTGIQFDYTFMLYVFGIYSLYICFKYLLSFSKSKRLTGLKQDSTYVISDSNEGIDFITERGTTKIIWRQIERVIKIENFVCVFLLDDSLFYVPVSLFSTEQPENEFIQLINKKIVQTRGSLNVPLFLKTPYFLGILCFIPIISVLTGITLIILGIVQYKDRILTFLGVLGIIFTIAFYSIAFPQMWSKTETDKAFANTSQLLLNNLVKDIEFYKLQHGHYPENLQQLQNSGSLIVIFDPLQAGNKNAIFNYVLIRDKYKLFSSGIDKIPNTKDDIYPQFNDTLKIGLTK